MLMKSLKEVSRRKDEVTKLKREEAVGISVHGGI